MKPYEDKSRTTNFVFDGTEIKEVEGSITVMIDDDDDLTALAALAAPGTIAYTAGWQAAWQLGTDGSTWTQFVGGGEGT